MAKTPSFPGPSPLWSKNHVSSISKEEMKDFWDTYFVDNELHKAALAVSQGTATPAQQMMVASAEADLTAVLGGEIYSHPNRIQPGKLNRKEGDAQRLVDAIPFISNPLACLDYIVSAEGTNFQISRDGDGNWTAYLATGKSSDHNSHKHLGIAIVVTCFHVVMNL